MAVGRGLALYHYVGCFFCARVQSAAEGFGIELELRNIHAHAEYADDLAAAMGRTTVPVLRIAEPGGEGRWLPESSDIIEYLEANAS